MPVGYSSTDNVTLHCSVQELSLSDNSSRTEELPSAGVCVDEFLEWQLQSRCFNVAALIRTSSTVMRWCLEGYELPRFISGSKRALEYRKILERKAMRGFELLVGSLSSEQEVREFFARRGYSRSNQGSVDLLLSPAWTKPSLRHALEITLKLRNASIVCFSHDADPVFVISSTY